MNFKTIGFGLATATTVMVGTVIIEAPAHALNIKVGNKFEFGSLQKIKITTTGIDFGANGPNLGASITLIDVLEADGVNSDSDWISNQGSLGTAKDVDFTPNPLPFMDFIVINLNDPSGDTLALDILTPLNTVVSQIPGNLDTFSASFETLIRNVSTGKVMGQGLLTAQVKDGFVVGTNEAVSSFSLSVTAVPTPALLPGLIGMSVAAVRKKRKGENAETAETATANA